jgi:hypothetical protein
MFTLGGEKNILLSEKIVQKSEVQFFFLGEPVVKAPLVRFALFNDIIKRGQFETFFGKIVDGDIEQFGVAF